MGKIAGRRLIIFFGVLLITAGMVSGGSLEAAASPSWLTARDYIEVTVSPTATQSAGQLYSDDMDDIAETLGTPVTWWGSEAGTVSADRRQAEADVYAVGGPFDDFHPVRMLKGSFLSREGENGRSMVLDSVLAWQLFGTTDAVGMEAEFQGKTYTVTGICEQDTSLLGLLSGNGMNCAYIGYGDPDSIPVTGMEASLPKSLPGKSLRAVKDALGTQGKTADSFLCRDITEGAKLDAESAGLPALALAVILTVIITGCAKATVSGMARGLRAYMDENYFADSWQTVLRHTAGMALAIAAAAGLVCALWLFAEFPFYLPRRFIPGSWIDIDFYKSLLQSRTQERIAAMGFIPQPWTIARDAGMQIAGYMNMLSFTGMAVFGAGLALLRDAREAQAVKKKGPQAEIMDITAVWIFLIASTVAGFLICSAIGLQTALPPGRTVMLCAGFTVWAGWILYKDRIPKNIHVKEF